MGSYLMSIFQKWDMIPEVRVSSIHTEDSVEYRIIGEFSGLENIYLKACFHLEDYASVEEVEPGIYIFTAEQKRRRLCLIELDDYNDLEVRVQKLRQVTSRLEHLKKADAFYDSKN